MSFRDSNRSSIAGVCRDCTERHEACHDTCNKYKAARAEYEHRKNIIKSAKAKEDSYDLYKLEAVRKAREKRR